MSSPMPRPMAELTPPGPTALLLRQTGTGAGAVGGVTAGAHGVLTLNADGSYSYVRNAGTSGGVTDIFTYTITDGDGDTDTATLTISIADALPVTAANGAVLLDDDALGGNAGGTGDDADFANLIGTLAASGGDGPLSWAFQADGRARWLQLCFRSCWLGAGAARCSNGSDDHAE